MDFPQTDVSSTDVPPTDVPPTDFSPNGRLPVYDQDISPKDVPPVGEMFVGETSNKEYRLKSKDSLLLRDGPLRRGWLRFRYRGVHQG